MITKDFDDSNDEFDHSSHDIINSLDLDEKNKNNKYRVSRRRKLEEYLEAKRFEASLDDDFGDLFNEE